VELKGVRPTTSKPAFGGGGACYRKKVTVVVLCSDDLSVTE
jgi:hypothetical protein